MLGTLVLLSALAFVALPPAAAEGWIWPVHGPVIARFAYARANPFVRGQRRGVDIAAPRGTPVVAACAGRVRFAGTIGTSGRTVSVACGRYVVSYLHLDRIATRRGARLGAGDSVGTVGTTGRRREVSPHLSFGVRRSVDRWGYVDPLRLLPREGGGPPDLAPPLRRRIAPRGSPLGPAPTPAHTRTVRGEQPGSLPAGAAAKVSGSGLPLGVLWLPAGTVLVLVAAAAPLATIRVRRVRRARRREAVPRTTLARRAI
jgi:hypothetical protein